MSRGLFWALNRVPTQENNWWLGNGAVPESDTYTIYDPLAAGDLATSYVNLANPGTRDATAPVAAPTHAQGTGWTFNGTTQYLSTNTNLTANSSIIIWVEDSTGVYAIGAFQGTATRWFVLRPVSSINTVPGYGSSLGTRLGDTYGGILGLKAQTPFKNAIQLATMSPTWSGADHSIPAFIGCLNDAGTATNFFGGRVLRVAIYDFQLSEAQFEAVTTSMYDYNQPAVNSYSSSILALNPIAYYPCNQAIGSALFDYSGNEAHAEVYKLPVGQPGLLGNSIAGDGNANNCFRTIPGRANTDRIWATRTGIDIDNYWFSVLMKINADVGNQVRVLNQYAGSGTEYFALECRNGTQLALYCRENATNQSTAVLANVTDGEWAHIVAYNSLATNTIGIYLNGVNYEVAKTLTGFTGVIDDLFPYVGQDLDGNFQHIAFFNGKPTQEQVDSINPI